MGASTSVLGHSTSSPGETNNGKGGPPVSLQPPHEMRSVEGLASSSTAQSPEPGFVSTSEESIPGMDLSSHRLSNKLHLLLYAPSLFDDLVSEGEEMDVQAFVFFIQEILHKCTLRDKYLRTRVAESLSARLRTKLANDFHSRSIRWNDAESVIGSILNEVWSNPALFQD